jgi:nitrogen regulatory protein P-II 1
MTIKKITAIIDELQLEAVEQALATHGVAGFTIHPVRGRGKYCNTYSKDQLVAHTQIEIYCNGEYAEQIAKVIMATADVGADGEGLVAVIPVDQLYWVCTQQPAESGDFKFKEVTHEQ